MSTRSNLARQRRQAEDTPDDLAMFGEMLADYGAYRLRRIMREAFNKLEARLAVLRRIAAQAEVASREARPCDVGAGDAGASDVEECARQLQFLRIEGFDVGLRSFSEACRTHERRARNGVALAKAEAEALAEICRAARDRMERLLRVLVAKVPQTA